MTAKAPTYIHAIPAFNDNYIWQIGHEKTNYFSLVDPGDSVPVRAHQQQSGKKLREILITHHHHDHTGGLTQLALSPNVIVYGPGYDTHAAITHPVKDGDHITLSTLPEPMEVIATPGHTKDHIAYYGNGCLFCGDTLFAGGCGRAFECHTDTLYDSLMRLAKLPLNTWVYCAHEYTLNNLRFAAWVEPDNTAVQKRLTKVEQLRGQNQATVPSQLATELATNPFLRCDKEPLIKRVCSLNTCADHSPAAIFAALRHLKDHWRHTPF